MDELLTAPVLPILGDVNMVDSEKIESGIQDNDSSSVVVKKETSVINDRVCAKKRDKEKLGYTSEELEAFSKRVKIEACGSSDVSIEIPASFEQVDPMVESPDLTANSPDIVPPLKVALDWLSLCDTKRNLCKEYSDKSKKAAENEYALAQSLVHAETLLELVRTRNELKMAKGSLKLLDGEITKLVNQITVMENEFKDAAVKYTMVARIGMMLELNETKVTWNVREEIEAFKLKFPESNLKDWDVYLKLRTPVTK